MLKIADLVEALRNNSDQVYITPDGHTAYLLVGPERKLMIINRKESMKVMTEAQINEIIQSYLER